MPAVTQGARKLGTISGIGLVVGNTVGVGVLTNTGYMASDLGPGAIMLAWLLGGVMAMAGARCYAAIAAAIPRSGGEYRYLSELLHPFWGALAGWTSLLVGFSAPVALAAATLGPFFATLVPGVPARAVGAAAIVLATLAQAFDLRWSKGTQNALVAVKALLLGGFIVVGVALGSHAVPHWHAPAAPAGFPVRPFAVSLVYIAFAFSGWNTTVYAAEEFREPRRTVPRSMLLGTALVTGIYLLVNWIFVANLSGERLAGWLKGDTSRITLAHVLIDHMAGQGTARLASLFVVLSLLSSVMSMTLVGPRVSAAMAREGYLPRAFAGREGRPPRGAVLLQGALALLLLATHGFEDLLRSVGSILTLTSALTVVSLFRLRARGGADAVAPSPFVWVAAAIYVVGSAWMLWFAVSGSPSTLLWFAAVAAATGVGYTLSRRSRARAAAAPVADG